MVHVGTGEFILEMGAQIAHLKYSETDVALGSQRGNCEYLGLTPFAETGVALAVIVQWFGLLFALLLTSNL